MRCRVCDNGILELTTYTMAVNYKSQTQYIEAEIYKCISCNVEQSTGVLINRNQRKIQEVKDNINKKLEIDNE